MNGAECPYNDPHTAAPHLWLLRMRDGAVLEGVRVVNPFGQDGRLSADAARLLGAHGRGG